MEEKYSNNPGQANDNVADIYNFSWRGLTNDIVAGELSYLNGEIMKTAKLINNIYSTNNFNEMFTAYTELCNHQLGSLSWPEQFYNANKTDFEPYIRGDGKPAWYHDLSEADRKSFDLGLKCQRDAAQSVKPLDQIWMLMRTVPCEPLFKIVSATVNLDDWGFDEKLYEDVNNDLLYATKLFYRSFDVMENNDARYSKQYFKENYGKISNSDLINGYRKERLRDYRFSFSFYCAKIESRYKCSDYGVFGADLNYLMCMRTVDQYMKKVAEVLGSNIDSKLEACITESKKLEAVINARREKCTTDWFNSLLTSLEVLNQAIFDFCEMGLNVCKNYRNQIDAAPYCFMKKPYAFNSIQVKYGLKAFNSSPLSCGTNYGDIVGSIADVLTWHCHTFITREPPIK